MSTLSKIQLNYTLAKSELYFICPVEINTPIMKKLATETPARISIITSDEIQRYGYHLNENFYGSTVVDSGFQIDLVLFKRAALSCNPPEKTSIKLLYGSAFRTPNPCELYYHDGTNTQKPSMGLAHETIDNWADSKAAIKPQSEYCCLGLFISN